VWFPTPITAVLDLEECGAFSRGSLRISKKEKKKERSKERIKRKNDRDRDRERRKETKSFGFSKESTTFFALSHRF
jgi:hypothetical protein